MGSYYIMDNGFIINGFTLYNAATLSISFDIMANTRGLNHDFASGRNCDTASK
jgi:hypothetical protein